jgi:outer membrane protein TolC
MRKIILYQIAAICIIFFGTLYAKAPLTLSLDEAIQLAVRKNPNIQSVKLTYTLQKFDLWVQEWAFYPHYSLEAVGGVIVNGDEKKNFKGSPNWDVQPGVSLLTPIGTEISLNATNATTRYYNPGLTLKISQPLMRGFGKAIVEAALCNTKDSEVVSRLNIEGILRSTITAIINAYLDIVMAESQIKIDEDALKRAQKSVEQTKLFIKAGHKAGTELVTVQANVATTQTSLENDKNNLLQTRYALLAAIGLDPNTPVTFSSFDLGKLIAKYPLSSLDNTKRLMLENDIQYQTDQITLHGSSTRALITARDKTRWQLNLEVNAATGKDGRREYAGFNNLFNIATQAHSIYLNLTIPIDDQIAKQGVVSAKIALQQAELALLQEKWNKETNAINNWNTVGSAKRALAFAEDAENLQQRTYTLSFQKYLHGLIDSLELQSAQVQLISAQQALLSARIAYLKSLVNLDYLIGKTLKTWDVQVR